MKNGFCESSTTVERCKSNLNSQTPCAKDKADDYIPFLTQGPSDAGFPQRGQLFNSSLLQLRRTANTIVLQLSSKVFTALDVDSFLIGACETDDVQSLPSNLACFSNPYFFSPSTLRYSPFSSVRALSSSLHNDSEKSKVGPHFQGRAEKMASPATSPSSFQHIDNSDALPLTPLPRANMPFITPIQREGEFICGWGAAFINICVTFPINKAIFRQQLHGISGLKAIRQLRKDGLKYLYRGLLPPLLQKTMSLSVMFGMYFHCQDVLSEHFPNLGVTPNHALAALISGTLEATFMPFERIQTLMQNREFHNRFVNTPDAFRHVWGYGFKEYYRGLSLIIWRNGPSNVAFFLGREYIQDVTPQPDSESKKMLRDFLSGACLGAMISTAFFPLNVVKTRMQSKLGGVHDSGWATLKVLLAERKGRLKELFKGVHLNYTRSFISWGIINASFEVLIRLYNGESFTNT